MDRNALKKYFSHKLAALGYTGCKVEFELQTRETDGVSWYGTLCGDALRRLADRLILDTYSYATRNAVEQAAAFGVAIKINRPGRSEGFGPYTMAATADTRGVNLTPFQQCLLEIFVEVINEDLKARAEQLAREGYQLLDSTGEERRLRSYMTPNLAVMITEVPQPVFDPFLAIGEGAMPFLEGMARGMYQVFGLQADVYSLQTGKLLGSNKEFGFVRDTRATGPTKGAREVAQGAIQRAREQLVKHGLKKPGLSA